MLGLTLRSVRAQQDPDFGVVIVGHDRPWGIPDDPPLRFIAANWPAAPPGPDNADSGRKKHAISAFVLQRGGGLLMLLDADDSVDVHLVEAARAQIRPDQIGGLITDLRALRTAALPHPHVFDGEFHRIGDRAASRACDRTRPIRCAATRARRCAPIKMVETAPAHGAELARLRVCGNDVVNPSENHSEVPGPHAAWRRQLTARVQTRPVVRSTRRPRAGSASAWTRSAWYAAGLSGGMRAHGLIAARGLRPALRDAPIRTSVDPVRGAWRWKRASSLCGCVPPCRPVRRRQQPVLVDGARHVG